MAKFHATDSGVLYLRQRDYGLIGELLAKHRHRLRHLLKVETPAFTKALAPGVAIAEDPGNGNSFGLHRCGILAEGIIRTAELSEKRSDEHVKTMCDCFSEQGVSLLSPFLNKGSDDIYDLPIRRSRH